MSERVGRVTVEGQFILMDGSVVTPLEPTRRFSAAHFPLVADFSCAKPGQMETPWEQCVSSWIKAPPNTGGALDAIKHEFSWVWLYLDDNDPKKVIGFTSLGVQPLNDEVRLVIPYFGMSGLYRAKKDEPLSTRFAYRIFAGLLWFALMHRADTHVFLEVDPSNPARTKFYPQFGFVEVEEYVDETGARWVVMAHRLRD